MTNRDHSPRLLQIYAMLDREPAAVVAVTLMRWAQLAPELMSIIGEGGFKPLYNRSVRIASIQHPWLAHQLSEPAFSGRFSALQSCLEAVDLPTARQASALQFDIFFSMLSSLIGEQLTTRIAQSAWPDDLTPPFQKDSPL